MTKMGDKTCIIKNVLIKQGTEALHRLPLYRLKTDPAVKRHYQTKVCNFEY